jgi:hypothetical protein
MALFEPILAALNSGEVRYVVVGGVATRVASIRDLIHLKSLAGRPEDRQDIEALELILKRRTTDHG